jgi:hypothetical protein
MIAARYGACYRCHCQQDISKTSLWKFPNLEPQEKMKFLLMIAVRVAAQQSLGGEHHPGEHHPGEYHPGEYDSGGYTRRAAHVCLC